MNIPLLNVTTETAHHWNPTGFLWFGSIPQGGILRQRGMFLSLGLEGEREISTTGCHPSEVAIHMSHMKKGTSWLFMGVSQNGGTKLPTKNDHFGVFWGYHHLRKHPYRGMKNLSSCVGMCSHFNHEILGSRILKNNKDDSWFRYIVCRVPVWLWIHMVPEFWDGSLLPKNAYSKVRFVLLMEEILHHLGCKEPCK